MSEVCGRCYSPVKQDNCSRCRWPLANKGIFASGFAKGVLWGLIGGDLDYFYNIGADCARNSKLNRGAMNRLHEIEQASRGILRSIDSPRPEVRYQHQLLANSIWLLKCVGTDCCCCTAVLFSVCGVVSRHGMAWH